MEHLETLYEICEIISRDIKKMTEKIRTMGGELNKESLDYVDKLTHALKSVKTSIAMIEEEGGYSNGRGGSSYARGDRTGRVHWTDGSVSRDGMSYEDGASYARGRGSQAKRDSRGRYSSDSYGGYSREDAKDDMISELRELMQDAEPNMKGEFQAFISKLERM